MRYKLKEFLLFRGSQMPSYHRYLRDDINWLREQPGFAAHSINDKIGEYLNDVARKYLNDDDWTKPWVELGPLEKRQAFLFYGQLLQGFVPDAYEDLWIYLGLCTANNAENTPNLGPLYSELIDRCVTQPP
jgi:hypothetical protein